MIGRLGLRLTPFALFVILMIGGVAFATIVFKAAQREMARDAQKRVARPYTGAASDAQKLFLESRSGTSQRLFEIAFAAAAALLALQFSEKQRPQFSGHGVFGAFGLLVASIYSALLFQIGVSRCLEASLDDMFGPILTYPVLCQFWFLLAAVVLTAASLFRRPRGRLAVAMLVSLLSFSAGAAGIPSYSQCVTTWASSRSLILPDKGVVDAAKLVERLRARQKLTVNAQERCALTATILDAVRYAAISQGQPSTGKEGGEAMAILLRAARQAAEEPTLSPGELIGVLASIAEIWSVPSGIVDIDAPRTLFVTVVDRAAPAKNQWRAYTRCVLRLPPGTYAVRAALGSRIVYRGDIKVVDRARIPLDIPVTP